MEDELTQAKLVMIRKWHDQRGVPDLWTAECPYCRFVAMLAWVYPKEPKCETHNDLRKYQLKGYDVAMRLDREKGDYWVRAKVQRSHADNCPMNPNNDPFAKPQTHKQEVMNFGEASK